MSDDDSIISEEIDYRPDDESGSFHASEEHYNDATSKSKIIARAAVKSPVLGHTGWGGNVQKSTVPSETHSNDFSEDDYSAEFEETSAQGQFSVYSNDFDEENENIVADFAVRKTNTAVECKKTIETFDQLEQPLLQLPGINIASLQAEIALEEISKEVVRLRNQQKNLLQERRHVAREKKLRAENRRAQYDLELRNMKVELSDLRSENEMMRSQHSSVKKSLEIMTYSNTTLEEDLRMKTKESDEIKIKVIELQSKFEEQTQLLVDKEYDVQKKEAKWAEERNAFKEEILRFTLLSSVVQQSLEANELRLSRERERLPEEHRKLLDDQVTRNKTLEGLLMDRESALRTEETRRLAHFESRSREAADDIHRHRHRVDVEILEARDKLKDDILKFENEKEIFYSKMLVEKERIELQNFELIRREDRLKMGIKDLKIAAAELESSRRSVEPIMLSMAADRESVKENLRNSEFILQEAENRALDVEAAENILFKKESGIMEISSIAEEIRMKNGETNDALRQEVLQLNNAKKDLSSEKFRLHCIAIELASQNLEFRKSMGIITKFNKIQNPEKLTRSSSQDLRYGMKKTTSVTHENENENHDSGDRKYVPYKNKSKVDKKKVKTKTNIEKEHENENPNKKIAKQNECSTKTDTSDNEEGCTFSEEAKSRSPDSSTGPPSPFESSDEEYATRKFREVSSRNSYENAYSLPPSAVLDSFVRLDQISTTLQGLSNNLTRNESSLDSRMFTKKADPSIVFANRSVAPYDFMGDSKSCSQDFGFSGLMSSASPMRMRPLSSFFLEKETVDSRCSRNSDRNTVGDSTDYMQFNNREVPSTGSSPLLAKNRVDFDYLSHRYNDNIEVEGDSSELRSAVEKAGEHANGLFAVAAKYGIYN